jgi:hypothetical protein
MYQTLKRRSTGTSGGLDDYYFSSYAGVGASSSTSSFSTSPGPSHEMMFGSPTTSNIEMSRGPSRQAGGSHANLRDLIHEEEEGETVSPEQYLSRLPRPPYSHNSSDDRGQGDSSSPNGRMQISTSDDNRLHPLRQDSMDKQISPGGYSNSSASHYSSSELSSDNESFGFDVNGRPLNGLMGPRAETAWNRSLSRIEVRESVDSSITVMDPYTPDPPLQNERFETTPQNGRYPTTHLSPRDSNAPTSPASTSDRTPTLGGPVMSSGRLANIAHPASSKSSLVSDRTRHLRRRPNLGSVWVDRMRKGKKLSKVGIGGQCRQTPLVDCLAIPYYRPIGSTARLPDRVIQILVLQRALSHLHEVHYGPSEYHSIPISNQAD